MAASRKRKADLPLYICLDSSDGSVENEVLHGFARVKMLGARNVADLKDADLQEASVCAVWHTLRLDAALLAQLPRCLAIVRMGVGYDNVDIAAAGRLGISVCNIPDYGTEEVADSTMALTLGLFRGALAGARLLHEPGREVRGADAIAAAVPYVRRVRGSTLGLVGLGRIGSAVAARAKACGFDVVFFDPYREDGADKALGIARAATLDELLAASDCVSLHANCVSAGVSAEGARAAPEKLIGADALRKMRPGALLVNTARGELVDEEALCAALHSGQLGAAALDVHWSEPWARREVGSLAGAPNLFCCPHQAWYSPESRAEMRSKGAEAARRALGSLGSHIPKPGEGLRHLLRNVVNASLIDEEEMAKRFSPA